MAKMQMRVRVSVLNFTVEVSGKGSAFSVTDSRAMARVELASLNKTGGFALAALVTLKLPQTAPRKRKLMNVRTHLGGQRRELVFIGWELHYRFVPKGNAKRANYEADSQLDWWRGHPANNPGWRNYITFEHP
jgi:hypothetical protein